MSWTLTTSAAALLKAGLYANSTLTASSVALATFSDQAEAALSTATRKDWVTDYASVGTNFKPMLSDVVSDMIAVKIITYDMSGYTSRTEAQTMLDVLTDNIGRNTAILKEDKHKEVMD